MDLFFKDDLINQFEKSTYYVKSVAGELDSKTLLYLYARYKQANEGQCNISKPGFFDFQGKQKWEAWKKLGDMEKSEAMCQYVTAVSEYDPDWEDKLDSGQVKQTAGLGVGVSTMCNHDDDLSDDQKSIFDWCKEGNIGQVKALLANQSGAADVHQTDENGMTLLHWCCDRGHTELIHLLMQHNVNVNMRDGDGQTPLHYAVSCEHIDVVRCLLEHGADVSLVDCDGDKPADITENSTIKKLLVNR